MTNPGVRARVLAPTTSWTFRPPLSFRLAKAKSRSELALRSAAYCESRNHSLTGHTPNCCALAVLAESYMGTNAALPPTQCPAVRMRLCPPLCTTLAVQEWAFMPLSVWKRMPTDLMPSKWSPSTAATPERVLRGAVQPCGRAARPEGSVAEAMRSGVQNRMAS
nr:hypothetical protein [Streptomyces sp. IMTB 2501]